ncbi:MAG TPA: glycosyltransferase [Thermoanaerobaculia bacterium]|nr:glycosyltransferase [Thermoanaerobaculia bacterium]
MCAIVPAFNEESTVGEAVRPLLECELVDRVVVISDGSGDGTATAARAVGAEAVELPRNGGKGAALRAGSRITRCPILLFSDADLSGLDRDFYRSLIAPVLAGERAMMVGVRDRGALLNGVQRRWGPLLSGVRCLERRMLLATPRWALESYRVETGLNDAARRLGAEVGVVLMPRTVSHRMKERKIGLGGGLWARTHMFAQVLAAFLRLRWGEESRRCGPRQRSVSPGPGAGRRAPRPSASPAPR